VVELRQPVRIATSFGAPMRFRVSRSNASGSTMPEGSVCSSMSTMAAERYSTVV